MRLGRARSERGQSAIETAMLLPLLALLTFGAFQLGRLFYLYNILHKDVKNGAQYLQRTQGANFCDANDPFVTDAKNLVVFGTIDASSPQLVNGLTLDIVNVIPERSDPMSGAVSVCPCGGDGSCDVVNGGTPPDFITITLGNGYPLDMSLPFASFGIVPVKVAVRLPFIGA